MLFRSPEKATALFEAAYDEHARRLAKLYQDLGKTDSISVSKSRQHDL